MKALYLALRSRIETETSVQHVRLWNNQVNLANQNEQIPFLFPAVFIDFPTIEWTQLSKGKQNSTLIVRVYIVFESFHTNENEEDVAVFDLRDEVYLALQNYQPSMSSALIRVAEQTDINHTNMYVWQMDFSCSFTDDVASEPRNPQNATVTTLTLDTDLIIDPNTVDGVRTDKDFD
jgi:hypothetical protein